ncbi:MAG TPA: NUDIX hydrolase [Myxococcaceae bacterium]|nr:NUDIX hydrolase [Myxococcaceae bacterium]
MERSPADVVTDIEVVEDLTARSRCDEGFLHVKRLLCRNHRGDGSTSRDYRVDVVDRPIPDAVAVLIWRRGTQGFEVLTRKTLRPAALFRAGMSLPVPDPRRYLLLEELVAGILEPQDRGEAGVRRRAVEETLEEAGYRVSPDEIRLLGGSFFLAPGILSEKIHPTAVDVTGKAQEKPEGDGSPLEEGATLHWWPVAALLQACRTGEVEDAKTEISVARFMSEGVGVTPGGIH